MPLVGATAIDPLEFRRAIGRFATGVTVITATHGGRRYAMTANSVTSASIDPPLVLVCFMHDSETGSAVRASGTFALNVLRAEGGRELARSCARKLAPGEDQLAGVATTSGPGGLPLLDDALEQLACTVVQATVVGDHEVVLARAEPIAPVAADADPLVFYRGAFWRLATPR
jgi:flavin reductase (DIM6/NTAB) family NADH-FMN oxidoreductase RutF